MSNPHVACRLFPYDHASPEATEAAVAEWYAAHSRSHLLKDPSLVVLEGKTFLWAYGTSIACVADQARVTERIRSAADMDRAMPGIAVAGPASIPPSGPRVLR